MQVITVGSKNQIVLPKEVRKKIKGLQPGKKVLIYPLNADTIAIKVDNKDWVERTYGIAKQAWKGIDPNKELKRIRNEWNNRP